MTTNKTLGAALGAMVLLALALLPAPLRAGQRAPRAADLIVAAGPPEPTDAAGWMERRWKDGWVVTAAETASDCNGIYTDNRVSGARIESHGQQRFAAGTPAHVDAVFLTANRLSLKMTLNENLLVTRQMGEVTLHGQAACRVALKLPVPEGLAKGDDWPGVESLLKPYLERYSSEDQAILASNFLPRDDPGYAAARAEAIAEHRKEDGPPAAVASDGRLNQWISQTARVSDQISSDPDYLAGFARGVEAGRALPPSCTDLAQSGPAQQPPRGPMTAEFASKGSRQKMWSRGYQDGMRLSVGLEAMKALPQCSTAAERGQAGGGR